MTTLCEAVENIGKVLKERKYQYLIHMMDNMLEHNDVKTVGIYGEITEHGIYVFKAIAAVGPGSPDHRHAEDLLLSNLAMSDIKGVHAFVMLSRIPCAKCMGNILMRQWDKLTLLIPSRLDSKSKWFDTQVRALTYMNDNFKIDKDSEDNIYSLVYIDD